MLYTMPPLAYLAHRCYSTARAPGRTMSEAIEEVKSKQASRRCMIIGIVVGVCLVVVAVVAILACKRRQ